jgi:hypothetical protein
LRVKYGVLGKIKEGNNLGWLVKIIDDREHTGGFYINEFENPNGDEGFDTWLETENDVKGYIVENGWKIEWIY